MMEEEPCESTPPEKLREYIMDCNIPKSESEWWAREEIETLQARIAELEASQPVPASSELVEKLQSDRWEGLKGEKGCKACQGKGWHYVVVDPDLDTQRPTPCSWCLVPRAIIPIIQADERERDAKVLQSAVETLAASRHLIGKYAPDHHWLPEHDERIAALKTAIRERNGG